MGNLKENNKDAYNKALPYFEKGSCDCVHIANNTGVDHSVVLTALSKYLCKYAKREAPVCPTCGKQKHQNEENGCRDVFHYL